MAFIGRRETRSRSWLLMSRTSSFSCRIKGSPFQCRSRSCRVFSSVIPTRKACVRGLPPTQPRCSATNANTNYALPNQKGRLGHGYGALLHGCFGCDRRNLVYGDSESLSFGASDGLLAGSAPCCGVRGGH